MNALPRSYLFVPGDRPERFAKRRRHQGRIRDVLPAEPEARLRGRHQHFQPLRRVIARVG